MEEADKNKARKYIIRKLIKAKTIKRIYVMDENVK